MKPYCGLFTASKAVFFFFFFWSGCCPNIMYWFTLTSNIFSHSWKNHFLHLFKKKNTWLSFFGIGPQLRAESMKTVFPSEKCFYTFCWSLVWTWMSAGTLRTVFPGGSVHFYCDVCRDAFGGGSWSLEDCSTSAFTQNRAFILWPASKFQLINLLICFHLQKKKRKRAEEVALTAG